jgi:hypothetical protein
MLRITINDGPDGQRWLLQGRLAALSVTELSAVWTKSRASSDGRRCVVDLTDVTGIDRCGEELLQTMRRAGAVFIASGVYITHIIDMINSQSEFNGERESAGCAETLANQKRQRQSRRKS